MIKGTITKSLFAICLLCLAGTMSMQAGKYKSFKVSVYARAYEVDKMKDLQWLDGTQVKSPVAILYGAVQLDAFAIQTQSEGFDYWDQIKRWQAAFGSLGVNTDIIQEAEDLSGDPVFAQLYTDNMFF